MLLTFESRRDAVVWILACTLVVVFYVSIFQGETWGGPAGSIALGLVMINRGLRPHRTHHGWVAFGGLMLVMAVVRFFLEF